ncbi:MAG: energy-dependent translational throttle protein EttA [Planctomycetota bacterium]
MAPDIIFQLKLDTKLFEGQRVLENINLSFYKGAKIGVVGGNGSGKSTLLRIIAGEDADFEGTVYRRDSTRFGLVPQEPTLDPEKTVRESVAEALAGTQALIDRYNAVGEKMAHPDLDADALEALSTEMADLQDRIDACQGWEIERKLEVAADALMLPPDDLQIKVLSGGEKRRVALCRMLLIQPDVLLLDEPTNHLDAETVAWLEAHLKDYPGTVIAVTHDRYFLDNAAGWILELDRGRGIPYEGNYTAWLEGKNKRLDVEKKNQAARRKILDRELEWIRTSPRGRMAKSRARIANYERLAAEEFDEREEAIELQLPPGPPLGDRVIDAAGLAKAFGERSLFAGLDFNVPKGAIVGVIGPNGAGKTTLFKMIVGQEKADQGSLAVGESVSLAYIDQTRESLDPAKSVYDEISGGEDFMLFGKKRVNSRAYVGRFNFNGRDQQKKVGELSGGQRNRVQLAKLLRTGGNVLLLDEPTNDLDVETLRVLEEALLDFQGCVMVCSHDRWFLDRIATHILAFEGNGHVVWFEGNFQFYLETRMKQLGEDPFNLRRARYRKLTV